MKNVTNTEKHREKNSEQRSERDREANTTTYILVIAEHRIDCVLMFSFHSYSITRSLACLLAVSSLFFRVLLCCKFSTALPLFWCRQLIVWIETNVCFNLICFCFYCACVSVRSHFNINMLFSLVVCIKWIYYLRLHTHTHTHCHPLIFPFSLFLSFICINLKHVRKCVMTPAQQMKNIQHTHAHREHTSLLWLSRAGTNWQPHILINVDPM